MNLVPFSFQELLILLVLTSVCVSEHHDHDVGTKYNGNSGVEASLGYVITMSQNPEPRTQFAL